MRVRFGSVSLGPVLAIAGLVALGAAGYGLFGGECSSCRVDTAVLTTLASGDECPLGECCPFEGAELVSLDVASECSADKVGCSGEVVACTTVANACEAKTECSQIAADRTGCEEECDGCEECEAEVQVAANPK